MPTKRADITKLARSARPHQQIAAYERLLALDAASARAVILELLQDHDARARGLAAEWIAERLDDAELVHAALELARQPGAAAALVQAVLFALRALSDGGAPDDVEALTALLDEASRSDDPDVRYQAIAVREQRREESPAYVATLLDAIASSDGDLRIVAAQGLARMGREEAIEPLRDAMARASSTDAFHLLLALAQLRAPGLLQPLLDAMGPGETAFAAVEALGAYGDPGAAPTLSRVSRSWFAEVLLRVAAAKALAQLGEPEGFELLHGFAVGRKPEARGFALQTLAALDAPNVERLLIDTLARDADAVGAIAAELLGVRRSDAALEALRKAAEHHSLAEVRKAAREALDATP